MFDYRELNGRIVSKFISRERFAMELGITPNSLSRKLLNKYDFKQREIYRACVLLDIAPEKIGTYFFTQKV